MANDRDAKLLLKGVDAWNEQRGYLKGNPWDSFADLSGLDFFNLFESAGKLGNDLEIPLAGYRFPSGNLKGARLIEANLRDAVLIFADLTNAWLSSAKLVDACLQYANLTGAWLYYADLTRADLSGSDLTHANLTRANLTHANLIDANLTHANLTHANLTNANLLRVKLTGADLTAVKLWEVISFDGAYRSPVQHQSRIERKSIKSLEDLLAVIKKIKSCYKGSEETPYFYFRGEAKRGYKLQPSVMREQFLIENERNMLTDLASRRPEEFNGLVSGLAQLVTAQHHGLKTRFLDISSNPLVALFHACGGWERSQDRSKYDGRLHVFVAPRQMVKPFNSDTVSVVANYARLPRHHQMALTGRTNEDASYPTAMEQLVQLIRSEKPYFESRINPRDFYRVIIVEPQQSPERIRAQSGAFLVSAFHERFERDEILKWNPRIPVYAHYPLTVSRKHKDRILDELRMFNITRETLFPGLDTAAEAIMESYRQRQQ